MQPYPPPTGTAKYEIKPYDNQQFNHWMRQLKHTIRKLLYYIIIINDTFGIFCA